MGIPILISIVICLIVYFIYLKRKLNVKLNLKYASEEDEFLVKGSKDKFIIDKSGRYEFLVVDGAICAVKDKSVSNKYVYYEEGE